MAKSLPIDACADCSAPNPAWAAVNRGVLLCDECCSVHRSFGSHVSQIKSITQSSWSPSLLHMVQQLHRSSAANRIWENNFHQLASQANAKVMRKKPGPKDSLTPTKESFIKSKHLRQAFIASPSLEAGAGVTNGGGGKGGDSLKALEKLHSQQLSANARTGNLETTLRLLTLSANPNYLLGQLNTAPIHVAASCGQIEQVELMCLHGGNPWLRDGVGNLPLDHAISNNHPTVATRLLELMFEIPDTMTFHLMGRKPDHSINEHFLAPPPLADQSPPSMGRKLLLSLPLDKFWDLARDIYDELQRRENEKIWSSSQPSALGSGILFLPVNPGLSQQRNQGRQKLARLNDLEFARLTRDVLLELQARARGSFHGRDLLPQPVSSLSEGVCAVPAAMNEPTRSSILSTEEGDQSLQIYDEVSGEDYYAPVATDGQRERKSDPVSLRHYAELSGPSREDYKSLQSELAGYRRTLTEFAAKEKEREDKLRDLQMMVRKLMQENTTLRSSMVAEVSGSRSSVGSPSAPFPSNGISSPTPSKRPSSMVDMPAPAPPASPPPAYPPSKDALYDAMDAIKEAISALFRAVRGAAPGSEGNRLGEWAAKVSAVQSAVAAMVALFPLAIPEEVVSSALARLVSSTSTLICLVDAQITASADGDVDLVAVGQEMIDASLEVAGATKQLLVTLDA